MREDLERLLDDITLMTLALAIALGWSLFQLAHGIGQLIQGLTTHLSPDELGFNSAGGNGLVWVVGHRLLDLVGVMYGIVELAVVLVVAVFVSRRAA